MIANDIDSEELKKPSVHADLAVHADAKDLLEQLGRSVGMKFWKKKETSWLKSLSKKGESSF